MGAIIRATELSVEPARVEGAVAKVAFKVRGPASAESTTTKLFGMTVKIEGVDIEDATLQSELVLVLEDGMWRVGCP
jgi:hypothetical protein